MINEYIVYKKVKIELGDGGFIDDIDFSIGSGEYCFLLGATGVGKSLFFKSLYGAKEILSGSARAFDFDLTSIQKNEVFKLRRKYGIIKDQLLILENRTVFDNVAIALRAHEENDEELIHEKVHQQLKEVHLEGVAHKLVSSLSNGEKRKTVLARSLVTEPLVLLADDPNLGLDAKSTYELMDLLFSISLDRKLSVILSTHNKDLIEIYRPRLFEFRENTINEISH